LAGAWEREAEEVRYSWSISWKWLPFVGGRRNCLFGEMNRGKWLEGVQNGGFEQRASENTIPYVPHTVPAELLMIPMIRTLAYRMFSVQVPTSAL
jgi:hypothetical protein